MVETQTAHRPTAEKSLVLHHEVEQFLYHEADLLDTWRLPEWLELFLPEGVYLVPATDKPDGDPGRDLFMVQDDRFLLEQRLNSLMKRAAHAEYPHSRTRHMITNVRVVEREDNTLDVRANFTVQRIRNGVMDTYVGHYEHLMVRDDEHGFRYRTRRCVLDLDALRPHGKVSIIL